jgi:hypothetical protein
MGLGALAAHAARRGMVPDGSCYLPSIVHGLKLDDVGVLFMVSRGKQLRRNVSAYALIVALPAPVAHADYAAGALHWSAMVAGYVARPAEPVRWRASKALSCSVVAHMGAPYGGLASTALRCPVSSRNAPRTEFFVRAGGRALFQDIKPTVTA